MREPVILLVESDGTAAQRIRTAFERRLLPRPHHLTSGEDAVVWAGANTCDACIVSTTLPGIDGMETFIRLKQRRPTMPVVMLSSVESEDMAVAAFRAGVADYVAKKPGFEETVAGIVQKIARPASAAPAAASVSDGIPDALLASTYQNKLRSIGRQLDLYRYQSVNLMEVAGGMLARVTATGSRVPEALEFLNQDFTHLLRSGIAARGEGERSRATTKLLPTGYEDFLRALGYMLDQHVAEAVSVTELDEFFAVGCIGKIEKSGQTVVGPLQWLLYAEDIEYLLNEAYRRRAPEPERKKQSGLGRMLGRRNG